MESTLRTLWTKRLVIALFYTSGFALSGLLVAIAGIVAALFMQRAGVRQKLAYVVPGLACWAGVYAAGVHPTIAGVIMGLITPVRAWLGPERFAENVREELDSLLGPAAPSDLTHALQMVDAARREAISPVESLIAKLHPWVAYAIMPLFALANAGVVFGASGEQQGANWVVWAVALGLLVGKPVGVLAATGIAAKLGWAELPRGITASHIVVLGLVAGIGFTMALFVARCARLPRHRSCVRQIWGSYCQADQPSSAPSDDPEVERDR